VDFDLWYRRYHPVLVAALTVVTGDAELARDAGDEALVRALERWPKVGEMSSPDGWTFRVAVTVARRRARRELFERRLLGRPEPMPPPELRPEVWAAVAALSRRQREAIVLRYVLGLSEAEVAETMGVAIGTASSTLAAARSRLGDLLRDSEGTEVTT
jgi:RNA polymerase sigma-70 factor (ECF subfamily)